MQDSIEDYIRISRNVKHLSTEPGQEAVISAQIKEECDAKAMQILHFAIDGKMRSDALFRCLPYINKSRYQDIVEERAITKICGYPLCSKKIPEMPKKQFFISVKNNKVYDITDRKNYCSNYCYRASIHIMNQVDSSPLWLRKHNEKTLFTLMHKSEKGLPGEVVNEGLTRSVIEPSFTSVSAFTQMAVDEAEEYELVPEEENKKQTRKPKKIQKTTMKTINEEEDQNEISETNKNIIDKHSIDKLDVPEPSKENNKENARKAVKEIDVESYIKDCLKEWLTLDTFMFIYGEEKMKEKLDSEDLFEFFESLKVSGRKLEQQKRYAKICKKLHMRDLSEEKFDKDTLGDKFLNPIPDYHQLKQENKELNVKVTSFYSGKLQIESDKSSACMSDNVNITKDEGIPAVLPLLDTSCQIALRRKIFSNSVSKTILVILQTLKISPSLVLSDLRGLIKTFRLKSDNIVFKPTLKNYVAIALLKILSIKDDSLRITLSEDSCREQLQFWLSHNGQWMDDILCNLLNVDTFIKNFVRTCN